MEKIIQQMKRGDERGFTLIELLIVIAIIAILAAIALPQFSAYRERGVRATMVTDARNLVSHIEGIFADCQAYPNGVVLVNGSNPITTAALGICGAASPNVNVNVSSGNNGSINTIAATNGYSIIINNANAGTGWFPVTLNGGGTTPPACQWTNLNRC
jgi:type IV pilus assembly protein PilA